MNKGIDNKVIDAISSYTFCVIVSSDDAGIKKYMNALATMPKANAIGMPENMTISVTAPYKVPKVNGLMRSPLFYSDRFFSTRQSWLATPSATTTASCQMPSWHTVSTVVVRKSMRWFGLLPKLHERGAMISRKRIRKKRRWQYPPESSATH